MSDDALAGFVRIGVPLDFFGRDFTAWLAGFKRRHPLVGLEVEANQSDNLRSRSARGEFDLAFFKQETGAKGNTVALTEQLVWVGGPSYAPESHESVPLILFPEGCAYRRFAISALQDSERLWHISFVAPSFECVRAAVLEGLGITVLARALVAPPLRILTQGIGLPQLPAVELAYSKNIRGNIEVVSELANYLASNLFHTSSSPVAENA